MNFLSLEQVKRSCHAGDTAKRPIQKSKRPKRPSDPNVAAHQTLRELTERLEEPKVTDAEVSRVMPMFGRKGGRLGGKSRFVTMTPERRNEIAARGARAMLAKEKARKLG